MKNALIEYTKITEVRFFQNNNLAYYDLIAMLTNDFGEPSNREVKEGKYLLFDDDFSNESVVVWLHDTNNAWYNHLEKKAKENIKNEIYQNLNIQENEVFIKYTIAELKDTYRQVREFHVHENLLEFQNFVLLKINEFITFLKANYLNIEDLTTKAENTVKIRWLGQKNVLGTLFYELWKGQTKEEGISTKPMIDVKEKNTLVDFIINNFVDSRNQEFSRDSLSGILSSSIGKQDEKATTKKIRFQTP